MRPELNREYPELDDPSVFDQMVKVTLSQMKPIDGQLRRGQHAKATGCVTAQFQVADNVPSHLRYGIFRELGRTFSAIVRFSNAKGTIEKDGAGTARGIAIKVLDVSGTRAVAGDGDSTQDFLMINDPIFPFPDPKAYLETMSRKGIPLVGDIVAGIHLKLFEPKQLKIVKRIQEKSVASPLSIQYWSGTPFWLGPASGEGGHAVKYSVVPHQTSGSAPLRPEDLPPDYLTQALTRELGAQDALFDFKVQWQTDPISMPVEDVSVEWEETDTNPVTVATLRIPRQNIDLKSDFAARCESMSFNPWHALAEHRPMGGMNRLRKAVYNASIARRAD